MALVPVALLVFVAISGVSTGQQYSIVEDQQKQQQHGVSSGQQCSVLEDQQLQKFIDITHALREDLPAFASLETPLGKVVTQLQSIANGSLANFSEMKMGVHTGTHVDSPSHFLQEALHAGLDTTNALDLAVLNGPVFVVEVPAESNITGQVIKSLVPAGVERVIFKTLNTARKLMWRVFVTDYTAFTADGSQYVASSTSIKLVGVDYLSVAVYDELTEAHTPLLKKGVVVVEGLKLDGVGSGLYMLHCLPTKLVGSDGSPARCILVL